jgi:uncharacterized protein DUF6895
LNRSLRRGAGTAPQAHSLPTVADEHLHARLADVLGYARASVKTLVGPDPATRRDRPESRKVLSETAVLLLVASRADDGRHAEVIDELAARIAPHARSQAVRLAVAGAPSRACWLGLAHIVLTNLGLPDPRFDQLLRYTLTGPIADACEREPHRVLDARWVRSLLDGGPVRHDDVEPLCVLGRGLDLMTGASEDAYALAHALFYATDFGRLPLRLARSSESVLADVEGAVAIALDADDLDLTAELLMAPALLGVPWTPVLTLAWHLLDAIWEESDVVPSPDLDVAGYRAAEGRERDRIVLRDTYHTMYAAGLLCATMLTSAHRPAARLPSGPTESSSDAWAERLRADQERAWLGILARLEAGHRAGALSLVLDAVARRRALGGDLSGLADVLAEAVRSGNGSRLVIEQTAQFMDRLLSTDGGTSPPRPRQSRR